MFQGGRPYLQVSSLRVSSVFRFRGIASSWLRVPAYAGTASGRKRPEIDLQKLIKEGKAIFCCSRRDKARSEGSPQTSPGRSAVGKLRGLWRREEGRLNGRPFS